MRKEFLTEDYLWSLRGRTRVDCRERCFACGILPRFADLRRLNPGDLWECPEVRSPQRIPERSLVSRAFAAAGVAVEAAGSGARPVPGLPVAT